MIDARPSSGCASRLTKPSSSRAALAAGVDASGVRVELFGGDDDV
jgi:hypothetical protein